MNNIDLFKNIPEPEIDSLLKLLNARLIHFKKDVTILSNLSNINRLGIIIKGSVLLIRMDYNGNRTVVETYKKGNIFGGCFLGFKNDELHILSNEESEIMFIDYDKIFQIRNNKNAFANELITNMISLLVQKVDNQNTRIELLTKKTIREKLLEYFHFLEKEKMTSSFKIPMNYTLLADYLAVDRSAMMREIKKLKEDGVIIADGTNITIVYN